jgi:PIN domain nuclease of toxin-antitoxin system
MRLLLDTHVVLWSLLEPSRLTPAVRAALTDERNELWISPITSWECLMLAERGRIELRPDPATWVRDHLLRHPLLEASLTHEIAIASRKMPLEHQDPADRFLAATAAVESLTLVTADDKLLASSAYAVLPAK